MGTPASLASPRQSRQSPGESHQSPLRARVTVTHAEGIPLPPKWDGAAALGHGLTLAGALQVPRAVLRSVRGFGACHPAAHIVAPPLSFHLLLPGKLVTPRCESRGAEMPKNRSSVGPSNRGGGGLQRNPAPVVCLLLDLQWGEGSLAMSQQHTFRGCPAERAGHQRWAMPLLPSPPVKRAKKKFAARFRKHHS